MMETSNTLHSGMCRCCASEGTFKDIKTKYHWMGDEEVYADMLSDCFDIKISTPEDMDNGICEVCITQLRNAANFKKQVLHTEEQFKKRLQGRDLKNPIKLESVEDPIESDRLSDPDFSGPEYDVPIKVEVEEKPKAKKRQAKTAATRAKKPKVEPETSTQHVSEDESLLVKERDETRSELEEETVEEQNCIGNITIVSTEGNYKGSQKKVVSVKNSSNSIVLNKTNELDLHLQNLRTVSECSNATAFRIHGTWYTCCFCPERSKDTVALKKHTTESHPNEDPAFVGRNVAELMIRVDITDLECKLCKTKIERLEKLVDHLKNDHSKKINTDIKNYLIPFKFNADKDLTCAVCELQFHNFKLLVHHMHVHYPNFECAVCGSGFINKRSALHHARIHATGEYKCEKCSRIFDTKAKLKSHIAGVHMGWKRNKCDYCNERFHGYVAKTAHMVKAHGLPELKAKCPACDRTFKTRKYLATHIRTYHMMEKRHKCPECDKMFFTPGEVRDHIITHTGRRDFECMICDKAYTRKSTLRQHMRIHANDRRYKCKHCGMAFIQKTSWRCHMRSKHGEEV